MELYYNFLKKEFNMHFNWTQLLPFVNHNNVHVATALVSLVLLLVLSTAAKLALGSGEVAVSPSQKFSIKGVFEMITEFIVDLTIMVCGNQGKKFIPLFACVFTYILLNNLMGLLPGMTPATDNINTTLAVGLFTFIVYNSMGVKEHGFKKYFKHFFGPFTGIMLFLIGPVIFTIEMISHTVRPISLGLRLQGNMIGDHAVLTAFLELVPYLIPAIFYLLGVFVCFMQAFVFTMLTMIYISMAVSHDH